MGYVDTPFWTIGAQFLVSTESGQDRTASLHCHRPRMARALVECCMQQRDRAVEVVHILADGSLETHEQSVDRLL